MKKILVTVLVLCVLCACFAGCTPTQNPTEEPTQAATEQATQQATEVATEAPTPTPAPESVMDSSKFTYCVLSDYTGHAPTYNNGTDGWQFSGAYEEITYEDGKIIIRETEGIIMYRFAFGAGFPAMPVKDYDAIAFYIENNSDEDAGISFFGEVSNSSSITCQLSYTATEFTDIECYLMDMEGNVTPGEEFLDDYGHALAVLPAGFKGYYICNLDTLGHDQCYYREWSVHDGCNNGEFDDSSYLSAGGLYLWTYYDENYYYVVNDYKLVNFNQD